LNGVCGSGKWGRAGVLNKRGFLEPDDPIVLEIMVALAGIVLGGWLFGRWFG
jgi:hypothetical protein